MNIVGSLSFEQESKARQLFFSNLAIIVKGYLTSKTYSIHHLKMEFCNFSFKTVIIRMFSLILFLGCACFVIHRGYECFLKYLEKPEAIDVAFKFSGSQVAFFPSITFCSWHKPNISKGCNLTSEDYLKKNIWVGQGHASCNDPKVLRNQIIYGLDDLKMEIDYFSVSTYEKSQLDSMALRVVEFSSEGYKIKKILA